MKKQSLTPYEWRYIQWPFRPLRTAGVMNSQVSWGLTSSWNHPSNIFLIWKSPVLSSKPVTVFTKASADSLPLREWTDKPLLFKTTQNWIKCGTGISQISCNPSWYLNARNCWPVLSDDRLVLGARAKLISLSASAFQSPTDLEAFLLKMGQLPKTAEVSFYLFFSQSVSNLITDYW